MPLKYTRETLERAVSSSRSFLDVLRNLKIRSASGGSYSHIKSRILELGLDTSHFSGKAWAKGVSPKSKLDPSAILVVLTAHRRAHAHMLRRALLESGVPLVCKSCGIGPEWKGQPLSLEVDHIDENWKDCRLQNLQFLCPNCHSQKGVNRGHTCACGARIQPKSSRCAKCNPGPLVHSAEKGSWPSREDLIRLVWEYPSTTLAKKIGVSSPMIKKRCKRLGINTPPRGYWAKQKAMVT